MELEWETYFYSKTKPGKLMTRKNDPPPKKYFKIVNPQGHYGVFYKEGDNEDVLPFNPDPYGEPGGIYFASKDIFSFINKGEDVYEVRPYGWTTKTKCKPEIFKAHKVHLQYLGKVWDTSTLQYLISSGADVASYFNKIKRYLSDLNKKPTIKFLSKFAKETSEKFKIIAKDKNGKPKAITIVKDDDYTGTLIRACANGNFGLVKIIVNHGANVNTNKGAPLVWAAMYGHIDIVKYLLDHGADIHAQFDRPLREAIYYNRFEVVKELLNRGCGLDNVEDVVKECVKFNCIDMIKLLLSYGLAEALDDKTKQELIDYAAKNKSAMIYGLLKRRLILQKKIR